MLLRRLREILLGQVGFSKMYVKIYHIGELDTEEPTPAKRCEQNSTFVYARALFDVLLYDET